MRASDADRDRVADQLREALAEGRITPEEHTERIEAVYAAKTYAELVPVLEDLPTAGDAPDTEVNLRKETSPQAPDRQSPTLVAIFSGAERKGRWLVEPTTNVITVFGGVTLDFREAVLSQREVTVNVTCIFGGVDIKVPPGVRVINSNVAIFGGTSVPGDDPLEAGAPVIRVTGLTLFGGVDAKRKSLKRRRNGSQG
ncbi:DUF1707 and DUF2154 domain-containing protein [Actinomadura craniellae]|uniref:DUF1707 and DUF2154 domain-containing protein n=2 Tax=Actinomadura craniellae TaxID=2231787 RepID=A0A365HBN6_9ACTN|nr:DUF1707 domain-containing protein [Actinomadura craniellae]RAY16517.1 DUF1707 and DUF2154 domain-containing protein [Actinomadura craniellae]